MWSTTEWSAILCVSLVESGHVFSGSYATIAKKSRGKKWGRHTMAATIGWIALKEALKEAFSKPAREYKYEARIIKRKPGKMNASPATTPPMRPADRQPKNIQSSAAKNTRRCGSNSHATRDTGRYTSKNRSRLTSTHSEEGAPWVDQKNVARLVMWDGMSKT